MTDADYFRHYKPFLNPSLAERFDYDPIDGFDPQLSVITGPPIATGKGAAMSGASASADGGAGGIKNAIAAGAMATAAASESLPTGIFYA